MPPRSTPFSKPPLIFLRSGVCMSPVPPKKIRHLETIWIPMSDGVRLAGRLWLPEDAEQHPVPAILEYIPYRRRDGTREGDELTHPYARGPWLCVPAPRHPRQRRFRRGDPRRIFQAGAGRRRRGHRLARGADLVRRQGRDDWNLLGRLQRAAGRRAPAAGPQGHRHRLLDRRPLCRRHAFHGRQPYDRQYGMGLQPSSPSWAARPIR